MPGRKYEPQSGYRYGFNGKEKDKDMHSLTAYDYGFRIYHPGIGKFLSIDPLVKEYPWFTPFQFTGNNPVLNIDIDGLEGKNSNNSEVCPYHKKTTVLNNGTFVWVAPKEWDLWEHKMNTLAPKGFYVAPPYSTWTEQFKVGYINTWAGFLGGLSEMPAQMHYGEKIKPENVNNVFPVTGDGNLKRIAAETITAPFYTLKEVIRDPSNGENWGSLTGMVILWKIGKTASGKNLILEAERNFFDPFGFRSAMTSTSEKWFSYEGEPLGYYKYSTTDGVAMSLNISSKFQDLGLGSMIFEIAMRETKTTKFTATWVESKIYETGASVNLKTYKYWVEKKGYSPTQAAWKTWSGKQAKRHGFKNVEVSSIQNGVQAVFTK